MYRGPQAYLVTLLRCAQGRRMRRLDKLSLRIRNGGVSSWFMFYHSAKRVVPESPWGRQVGLLLS
jgi:hypothetical protein